MNKSKPIRMTRAEAAAIARAARMARVPSLEERFWSKVDCRDDTQCWPWKAGVRRKDEGYGAFWLNRRHQPASRVAWILTHGEIAAGLVVCHRCDNPCCCNPAHLFIGTPQDNDADRVAKGRQCRGSQQRYSVLNEDLVIKLRALAAEIGVSAAAKELGINRATAQDACSRRWRHV